MKLRMYAVYDRKATVFARPFCSPNDAMAKRSFEAAKLDSNTELSKFPQDFGLYLLGEFDDDSGEITGFHPSPVSEEAV